MMIYRKWSLLTGPVAVLGGIVVTVIVTQSLFAGNDRFLKLEQRKAGAATSSKYDEEGATNECWP